MQLRKQKIGNILYWFSIGMLLAYVPVLLLRPGNLRAPMSDSDAAIWSILFAAAMATYVVSCILTGETGVRTVVVTREENPAFFKSLVVFYSLVAAILLIRGLIKFH